MKPERVAELALALPEATKAPHFQARSFRVRGRIFATLPPDGAHLHVFVDDQVRDQALAMNPQQLEALPWGGRIVGLRVRLAGAAESLVGQLLRQAWVAKSPVARPRVNGGTPARRQTR